MWSTISVSVSVSVSVSRSASASWSLATVATLPAKLSVEEVAVAGPAEQPWPGSWVVEPAESLDDVDAAPAGDSLGEPEQGFDSSWPPLESVRRQWSEVMGQQPDCLDQRDVFSCPHGGDQGQPNGDRASVGAMSDELAARSANAFPVRPLGCGGDVLVGVNRDVDVVESVGQFAGTGGGTREVRVQDECHVLAGQVPVLRFTRAFSMTVRVIAGVRLPVAMKRLSGSRLMQPERVVEQCCR
ncbi:hypothetical protein ACICHK_39825 [Streptomyces sp. AHU1]|uniref:hypothetical protein n=1 Tax=Streptomyces sp. AHU1 TaxID=3377215 RepID=UPI003877F8F9